jgi:hypothetical protein
VSSPSERELDALWARHSAEWRDPAQITSQWREAAHVDRQLLRCHAKGAWWETLADLGVTLLVTREYEHLVMALRVTDGKPDISYMPMPHPSGLAVDTARGIVHIASTRNPNQVYDFAPVTSVTPRLDVSWCPSDHAFSPAASTCTSLRWLAATSTRTLSGRTRWRACTTTAVLSESGGRAVSKRAMVRYSARTTSS